MYLLIEILYNTIVTFPSTFFHGNLNKFRYYLSRRKPEILSSDKSYLDLTSELLIFVHGRGGCCTDFDPLISNLKKLSIKNKMIQVDLGNTRNTLVSDDSKQLFDQLYGPTKYNIDVRQPIVLFGLS